MPLLTRRFASIATALLLSSLAVASASAQTEVRPRFLIAFDTSGSMTVDFNNIPTYGDGVPGATQGLDTDCDGQVDDSRLFIAKEALRNVILTFGDIEFALARFPQFGSSAPAAVCNDSSGFAQGLRLQQNECNLTPPGPFVGSVGNPALNMGAPVTLGNCGAEWDGDPAPETPFELIPSSCRPASPAFYDAASPQVCLNYVGGCPGNPFGTFTFDNGDVLVGFEGFGWPGGTDNRQGILRWIDNSETSFDASRTQGDFCDHSGSGDCELRAQGPTPLGGLLRAARDYIAPIRAADSVGTCRPYTVLLLTDGAEVCNQDPNSPDHPVNVANDLFVNSGIRTYVIGLAFGGLQLDEIAMAGGTGTAFVATDPNTLSAGLADIVAQSLLIEVCGNGDEDCDGAVDEGFVKYCNRPAGNTALTECIDPGETICDGLDDNCNGQIDEGLLNACGTCGAVTEVCGGGDEDCDGALDEGGVCNMCQPEPELCNNMDEDCDTRIDEDLRRPCGVTLGECTAGVETCSAGSWMGCTATVPTAEICDGLDNDCDGLPDNLTRPCGTNEGVCVEGIERCIGPDMWGACEGSVGSGTEVCNLLDDDCDGTVDEDVPGVGTACSEDRGECRAGTLRCVDGVEVCEGGVEPSAEICDDLDNDCDDLVDEGLDVGAPCGTGVGECVPGIQRCRDGVLACEGGVQPRDEVCDALDNDCDGPVDESLPLGGACGEEMGLCVPGTLSCVEGRETCIGGRPASRESCNCIDDDCDGEIDEDPDDGPVCPGESECVSCQCALPCRDSEFGFSCPTGRAPEEIEPGVCWCLADECDDAACAATTIEQDEQVRCAPDSDDVGACVCSGIECTFACAGVVCGDGTVCDPRDPDGLCVEDSCRGLGCAPGELCDPTSGECAADPCEGVMCATDEACRAGACEASCGDVECPSGQRCEGGACATDRCDGVECGAGMTCDPDDGSCVEDACDGVSCPRGEVCDAVEGCVADPCTGLRCPDGQMCEDGECTRDVVVEPDAGGQFDAGPDSEDRVLAAGGCGCRAAGEPSGRGEGLLGLLLLGLVFGRRRRRRKAQVTRGRRLPFLVTLAVLAAPALGGCEVEPFCLSCTDDDGGEPMDAGEEMDGEVQAEDAGGDGEDAGPDRPDGCVEGAFDDCNAFDDDCDGRLDEDVDTETDPNHCGSCGEACAPAHAFGECVAGGCTLGACDVGFHDINGDDLDGCEYACTPSATDDVICDLLDNDCDGSFDEDVLMDTDPLNCGDCGRRCRFAHAEAMCAGAVCRLGACDPGFVDADGEEATGCEYSCTPASPAVELCNGLDEDCDSRIDEGNPGGGASCGTDEGECTAGVETCDAGRVVCAGEVGPGVETCNTLDDDCDTRVDETTDFNNDPNNCGMCGMTCGALNAVTRCASGSCAQVGCATGWVDLTPATLSCDYECSISGGEVCDAIDNDCDGATDEDLNVPTNFCNPTGECGGTTAQCMGAAGWVCEYTDPDFEVNETLCDGLDNDCDGAFDEAHPLRDVECSNGLGQCLRSGVWQCTGDRMGLECTAAGAGTPMDEECDGEDNDCDGVTDEEVPMSEIPHVTFNNGAATVSIFRYEASRPDATAAAPGSVATAACSVANVRPWTVVTWPDARDACCALNDDNACPGAGQDGWRLCDAPDWQRACEGPAGSCDWSYSASCSASQPTRCNGEEFDCSGAPGDQDCVFPTGSPTFSGCYTEWNAAGRVNDMSGNIKEWTNTSVQPGVFQIRGGAQNNLEDGRTCDFSFAVASQDFAFSNTGFRCCHYDF